MRDRSLVLALVVLLLIGIGGYIAISRLGSSSPRPTVSAWKTTLLSQARSQDSYEKEINYTRFHALPKPRSVPANALSQAQHSLGPEWKSLGLNFSHSYYFRTRIGVGLWLVSGHGVSCIFNGRNFAVACDTSQNTARFGLVLVSGRSPIVYKHSVVIALGVAPDGISAVRFALHHGGERVAPVVDNTFSLRTFQPMSVVSVVRSAPASK